MIQIKIKRGKVPDGAKAAGSARRATPAPARASAEASVISTATCQGSEQRSAAREPIFSA
jgi:hypothetical protein